MVACSLLVFLLATAARSDPSPETDSYRVADSKGRTVASVRQSPLDQNRYDIVGTRGEQHATVYRRPDTRKQLDVRTADGRRRAALKPNLLSKTRIDEVNERGERTGYWERSSLTGNWHRYGADGRRTGKAALVKPR
jgi:hypothetical protein